MDPAGTRIGVLMGGLSAEREVSLKTGRAVLSSLERQGYEAVALDVDRRIAANLTRERIGLAFIALHGPLGEDGAIQGLLEILGIPYTGSGVMASALGMNKIASRKIFLYHRIPVPDFLVLSRGEPASDIPERLGLPLVVKPSCQGSSIGVSMVHRREAFDAALEAAFRLDRDILVEKLIEGKEVHVGILGERALGGIEILSETEFYDYTAKYTPGMSKHIFPARLAPESYQKILGYALEAHRALGCRGYSRVDFLVDEKEDPYLLELNTLPGMTPTSLLPEIAQGAGLGFDNLVRRIMDLALEAHAQARWDAGEGRA